MIGISSVRLPVLALAASMLWSCGTPHSYWYEPQADLTSATGATVNMSQNPPSASGPDGYTNVLTVDGQPLAAMQFAKVVLPPGAHTLGVQYNGAYAAATVEIHAMLQPGVSYTAKGQRDGVCDAMVWLEDQSTHQALGDRRLGHMTAKPMVTGAPVFAVACN
jgi:hypothetical protein